MYNEYFYPQLKYVSHPINQSTVSRRYSGILSSLPNFWSPCAENVQLISVSASPSHGERCSHCIHQHPVSADGTHHYTPLTVSTSTEGGTNCLDFFTETVVRIFWIKIALESYPLWVWVDVGCELSWCTVISCVVRGTVQYSTVQYSPRQPGHAYCVVLLEYLCDPDSVPLPWPPLHQ